MDSLLTNQLFFFSNAKHILALLRSKAPGHGASPLFSLESIKATPTSLLMPDFEYIRPLLALNIEIPGLAEKVRQVVLNQWFADPPYKADETSIRKRIDQLGGKLESASAERKNSVVPGSDKTLPELFEQAVDNYNKYKFFNQYDWRMAHWATTKDIQSVVESTFDTSTTYIEFATLWTPPLHAVQELADIFPSVRFELRYRYEKTDPWTNVEMFPIKPWGY
ncbi:MAG: hypothetical protein K9J79_09155 [Desulfobacteraceae bacterium]|nr:hypothetical protein [Desulfobacteraceae bacterium]